MTLASANTTKQDHIEDIPETVVKKFTAVEVLRETMNHHHGRAQDIIAHIILLLKDSNPPRADLITYMHKEYTACREVAVDCAAKLAPYESPKLQSMEVKSESVHSFVMRVPIPAISTKEWMEQTGAKDNKIIKTIEPLVRLPHTRYNDIDDEEDQQDQQEDIKNNLNNIEDAQIIIREDF